MSFTEDEAGTALMWLIIEKLYRRISSIVIVVGYIAAAIGIVSLIYWGVKLIFEKIWPGREEWEVRYRYDSHSYYTGNDLQRTLKRGNTLFWVSPVPQQIGNYYQVDLKKERIISEVQEIDIEFDNQIPLKYTLKLFNRGIPQYQEPNHRARDNIYGVGRVSQKFPPTKVQRIEIMIAKPNTDESGKPYHWKIYGIRLREVKLFHRFIEKDI